MALLLRSPLIVPAVIRLRRSAYGIAIVLSTLIGCAQSPTDRVQQKQLAEARRLHSEANWYYQQGEVSKAIGLARQALKIRLRILGEEHADTAASLHTLAAYYEWKWEYTKAEEHYLQTLEIQKKVLGEEHGDYAQTLNDLGTLYYSMGDYPAAKRFLLWAHKLCKKVHGENHPDYAKSLNNLGLLYLSKGDYARAEPLLVNASAVTKAQVGEDDFYATCLNNLALLYEAMGQYDKAEEQLLGAVELSKRNLGDNTPNYAARLNNLGTLYLEIGEFSKAKPQFEEAAAVTKEALNEKHPLYAMILANLAFVSASMGDFDNSLKLTLAARDLRKEVLGEKHPDYAVSLGILAQLYHRQGQYDEAERQYLKARDVTREALGEAHPRYAGTLFGLATLYRDLGDYKESEAFYRHSLKISRKLLDETASVQSELGQLQFASNLRYPLDHYISLALVTQRFGRAVFDEVLDWKGATMVRQRRLRQVAEESDVAETFAKLQTTIRRLSGLLRIAPPPDKQAAWQRQVDELTEKKDGLEAQLVQKSDRYRETKRRIRIQDLLAVLPDDSALVDLLEFSFVPLNTEKPGKRVPQRHFVAFVVRHGQPIEPIDLGPAEAIDQAVIDWRQTFGESPDSVAAGQFLRKQVWEPLEPRLQGIRQVLISPDKALGRMPFYALPGRQPNSYLIEDYLIASVPVPQLLPSLLQRNDGKRPQGDLLLVGDVDYTADPQGSAPSNVGPSQQQLMADLSFPSLPATAAEIDSIADLYQNSHSDSPDSVRTLRKAAVTESAFRREAATYRLLHLATHGYFADPTKQSALGTAPEESESMLMHLFGQSQAVSHVNGYHPGMLSGLALTGANRAPQPNQDDGILTAQEIAFMPLEGVELVVLSACETGLGPTAGGEGLLGVQRAFQVAGARTTVASLWKVDDQATEALMRLFYYKLWNEHKSPVEALRESQLALYRQPNQIERLASTRGPNFGEVVKIVECHQDQAAKLGNSDGKQGAPIGQWAAFVLSGDWR